MHEQICLTMFVCYLNTHAHELSARIVCLLHLIIWSVELGAKYVANVKQWMDLFLEKKQQKNHATFCILLLRPIAWSCRPVVNFLQCNTLFFSNAASCTVIPASQSASDWELFFVNCFSVLCLASLKDSGPHGNRVSSHSRSIKMIKSGGGKG